MASGGVAGDGRGAVARASRWSLLLVCLGLGCGTAPAAGSLQLGATCALDVECGSGFCEKPDGMCGALLGICQGTYPTADCVAGPAQCGCDGKTYPGDCARRKEAVSKEHDGACTLTGS